MSARYRFCHICATPFFTDARGRAFYCGPLCRNIARRRRARSARLNRWLLGRAR